MRDLWTFIKAVFSQWVSGMSGGAGVVLAAVTATGKVVESSQNKLFWAASAALVLIATYATWLKEYRGRLTAEMRPERCVRCGKGVWLWFIDRKTPLPQPDLNTRTARLMKERGLNFSDAMIGASDARPVREFGCLVCAGKARLYPDPYESRKEFEARLRLHESGGAA